MNRYINVLNNSYYSSKYKRNGSYSDGCRIPPTSTEEIDSFITEFNMNMKRYSIETKLASYGESLSYNDYSSFREPSSILPSAPVNTYSTLRPASYATLRPATTTTAATTTLRSSSPTNFATLRPATTSTLRPSSPSARASAAATLHPSSASRRSPSPSYRPSSSYATLRPATTSTLRRSPSPSLRPSSPSALRPVTTSTTGTLHSSPRQSPSSPVNKATSASTIQRPRLPAPSRPAPPPPKPRKETALVLYDISLDINPNVLVCNEGDRKSLNSCLIHRDYH